MTGDERGSVDRWNNEYGAPLIEPDGERAYLCETRMQSPPIKFDALARGIVERAIRDHCAIRRWELHAINVRTNHVHCVVSYAGMRPEIVMGQLKAWSTRRLREANCLGAGPCWTRQGSTRYLFKERDVADAVTYVMECQGSEFNS